MQREPFFGPNAKMFFFQLVFGIAFAILIAKPVAIYLGDNLLCKTMGVCSREAAARLSASEPE